MARLNQVQRFQSSEFRGTTPSYVVPDDTSGVWNQISSKIGKVADAQVSDEKYQQGVKEQTEAGQNAASTKAPVTNIAGESGGIGISSRAYAKGAAAAFTLQKRAELDTAFTSYQQKHPNNFEEFKKDWNNNFIPNFFSTIPTNQQAAFRLETTERFNRVSAGINERNLRLGRQRDAATELSSIEKLTNDISLLVAQGKTFDQNTGKTLADLLTDANNAITALDERSPATAAKAKTTLQQEIRASEYKAHFNTLTDAEKETFLEEMRTYVFDGTKMQGETLSPQLRQRTVYQLQRLHNATKTTNKAETVRLKSELRATELALIGGVGSERDLTGLLEQADTLLPEQSDDWRMRLTRAKGFAEEVKAINALPVPIQTKRLSEMQTKFEEAQAAFNSGKITASDFAWEQAKLEGIAKLVATRKRRINTDAWSMLSEPDAPTFDLNTEDGIYAARTWIANKTGIALYSVPPLSKERLDAHRTDILEEPDSVQRAAKIQQLRKQLGDNQFNDAFALMKLDESYLSVAFATNPQAGANIIIAMDEGAALVGRADKTKIDTVHRQFDNEFGKALNFDITKREQLREAYTKLFLAYEARGSSDAKESALNALITGKKFITLENGEKRLVPNAVDENGVRKAIADVKSRWATLGVILPPNVTYTDVSIDSFSPQVVGNKLLFFSPNKIPVKIRGRNADRSEILQVDLSNYEIAQDEEFSQQTNVWNGITVPAPTTVRGGFLNKEVPKGYEDANAFLDKIVAENAEGLAADDSADDAARYITNKPYEQKRLQAFVAVIRNGELPQWGMQFINQFELTKVRYQPDYDDLKKRWKEHNKSEVLVGGAVATPLELLMTLVRQVRQTPFDTGYARRQQRRR